MSSEPSDPAKRAPRFERWRKIMLAGGLLLLANALARALLKSDMPRWLYVGGNIAGYIVLAVGFSTFYRDRRN